MSARGVFLDRDGTINEEVHFLRRPEDVRLIPGAADAIRRLNDLGLLVCVISNQSGVARGILTEEDLGPIHERLVAALGKAHAAVNRIYYCPHLPDADVPRYRQACVCRKPSPGMLLRAAEEFDIDLRESFVVGDRMVDVLAGKAVGATTFLVRTGYGTSAEAEARVSPIRPDRIVPSIVEAVDDIVSLV